MKPGRQTRGKGPTSALAGMACLPAQLHSRKPTWEGECWEEEERKERFMRGEMRTKDSWPGGWWFCAFFFYLEFLCKGRKHQLFRKPSAH